MTEITIGSAKASDKRLHFVSVLGWPSSGKTTLLNAMIGIRGMGQVPSGKLFDRSPCIFVEKGPTSELDCYYRDGTVALREKIRPRQEVAIPVDPGRELSHLVRFRSPSSILDRIVLLEFDCRSREYHAARDPFCWSMASSHLKMSKVIIYVLDATLPFEEEHHGILDWIASMRSPAEKYAYGDRVILFVLNKWGLLNPVVRLPVGPAMVDQYFRTKLATYTTDSGGVDRYAERVFTVDALRALDVRTAILLDQSDLETTNVPSLERTLEGLLNAIDASDR